MSVIHVLPDILANQIAAGEVIERPASVVKELLENALDAGASRIRVELSAGGRSRILVEDDGCGMEPEDLLLAVERHATSKLRCPEDLFAIATLGFRGEALPSISSVSRLTIQSRVKDASEGASLRVEGGRFGAVEPCGLAVGTRVEVEDLFYNVPARRKFLKAPGTELSHAIALIENYALARPDVAFTLLHEGREVIDLPPARAMRERFFTLFPEFPEADLAEVEYEFNAISIRGLAAVPSRNLATPRYQFTLVNGRFVRDRLLQHAVAMAYENTHPKGRYPVLLLNVTVPASAVDVNVHPSKREVRFSDSQGVHQAVLHGIRRAIAPGTPLPAAAGSFVPQTSPAFAWAANQMVREASPLFISAPSSPAPAVDAASALKPAPLRALAQWRQSFIICDGPDGLCVVDQHVAHERIRFEQLRRFIEMKGPTQPFLDPRPYELPRNVKHRAGEFAELLTAQGFDAELFGEGQVAVRGAPAFLTDREINLILDEFFESAGELLKTPREQWKKVLIMRSCRGSVMLNDQLTLEKMQFLLDTLLSLGAPLTCPHGRPIIHTLREAEVLAWFGRK